MVGNGGGGFRRPRDRLPDNPPPGERSGAGQRARRYAGDFGQAGLPGPRSAGHGSRRGAPNDRPEFARLIVNTNPHPLGRFRAIGPTSNLQEFARAFACKPGDPMVRAERCEIW